MRDRPARLRWPAVSSPAERLEPQSALLSVSPDDFRAAMSRWASGVSVVTAEGPAGPVGMTCSSFSSVSLAPPLVLVCIARDAGSHDPLVGAPAFAVHLLEEGQREVSERFARPSADRFHDLEVERGPLGAPLLHVGLARLACVRHDTADGGDHTILVGRVVQVDVRHGEPLLYYRGGYRGLSATDAI